MDEQAVYRLLICVLKPVTKTLMQRQKGKQIPIYVSENFKWLTGLFRHFPKRSTRRIDDDGILRSGYLDAFFIPPMDFAPPDCLTTRDEGAGQHCGTAGKAAVG
ncbi:hypothetical protein [Dyadobacter sp. 676]|uniref:Uncharacterized protein n=1 Tax=Dyadobacter sp. 676 TaxID=3088362 RepID=A0AAU8FP49_9BACT